jgi:endonuclease III
VRGDEEPVRFVGPLLEDDAQPERLESPQPALAVNVDALDREVVGGEAQDLALAGAAVAEAEGEVEGEDVEPEKPDDRPAAERHENDADDEAQQPQRQHQQVKAARRQAAVRQQHALEEDVRAPVHRAKIGCGDAPLKRVLAFAGRRGRPYTRAMRPFSKREVAEFYRRLADSRPIPKTELEFINPFTLLVAVVLSAQATDVGVNRATPPLFAVADTPQKMLALGEERLIQFIRTLGLYRTKAKNIMTLSRLLVAEHGGAVPRQREALERLPGVGRKTANVVLNVAFGEPTIAVDTHIFRVANRTGLAPGKTPLAVEEGLEKVTPAAYKLGAHHWLILHGRYVCKARKPDCPRCVVADLCRYGAKTAPEEIPKELIAARSAAAVAEERQARPRRRRAKPSPAPRARGGPPR